jgi:hypothetical protein
MRKYQQERGVPAGERSSSSGNTTVVVSLRKKDFLTSRKALYGGVLLTLVILQK